VNLEQSNVDHQTPFYHRHPGGRPSRLRRGENRPTPIPPAGFNVTITSPAAENQTPQTAKATYTPRDTWTPEPSYTPASEPYGYQLVDWREPAEVITPENLERIELPGKLVFQGGADPFAWSPDGTLLAVFDFELGNFVLDAATFEENHRLGGYSHLAFSYDGKILETGGKQFNLETGEPMGPSMTFHPYPGVITDIEFSPDGKFVVGAGTDRIDILRLPDHRVSDFSRDALPRNASVSRDSLTVAVAS
jgi:WD40 repeat protein